MPTRYALEGARSDLSDPAQICALMAQDLNDLRRENGEATHENLREKGWSSPQIKSFFLTALEEAYRTFSETRPAPWKDSEQARPFLAFDADMRAQLARIETIEPPSRFDDEGDE